MRRPRPTHGRGPHFGTNGQANGAANDMHMQHGPQQTPLDRHTPYRSDFSGEYGSPPGSNFGSPPFDAQMTRSPPFRSALDAPLPPSFSSQDLPNIQKFGPNAMSVPANGGLGPFAASSPATSTVSRDTYSNLDSTLSDNIEKLDLGSSPPDRAELAARRNGSNWRLLRNRDLPASVPARERYELFRGMGRPDSPTDDNHEEDFLPSALSDLLTPQEKMRRFSRSQDESGVPSRQGGSLNAKIGSPSQASPSRFSGFFAEQAKRDAGGQQPGSSPFGHVGSPLRNSSFPSHVTRSPEVGGGHSPSFGPISPPGFKERPGGVSSLSEQLRKARNPSVADPQTNAGNAAGQTTTSPAPRSASGPAAMARNQRVMSTGSGPERIDEEDPCFFSMEDEKAQ